MVWARDSNHGVYVREAVYPELPVGTGWFPVTGLSVVSLAISRTTVWALSTSGQVFRRRGVSSTDWAGEAWQAIPAPEGQVRAHFISKSNYPFNEMSCFWYFTSQMKVCWYP